MVVICSVYLSIYATCVILVTLATFLSPYLINRSFPSSVFSYMCPTTIIGALAMLLCFSKLNLQNKFINWCGISCFAVFLMHVSPSTLWHFKALFIYLHESLSLPMFWLMTFIILALIFMISILIDKVRIMVWNKVYKHLEPSLNRISNK